VNDFERAIVECPTDRSLRLVYADWLEENGDTPADRLRLELIRLDAESDRLRSLSWPEAGFATGREFGDHVHGLHTRRRDLLAGSAAVLVRAHPDLYTVYGGTAGISGADWRYGFPYDPPPIPLAWLLGGPVVTSRIDALVRMVKNNPVCGLGMQGFEPERGQGRWSWYVTYEPNEWRYHPYYRVPTVLEPFLRPTLRSPSKIHACYAGRREAIADLKRAVVRYLRHRAELPDVDLSALDRPPSAGRARPATPGGPPCAGPIS
jgi:uncharacterized protein (TIGR02996 family)